MGQSSHSSYSSQIGASNIETLAMGGPDSAPKIADYLANPDPKVRDKAVAQLAKMGPDAQTATATILLHLRNQDGGIRLAAAKAAALLAFETLEDGIEKAAKDSLIPVQAFGHLGLARLDSDDCADEMENIAELIHKGQGSVPGLVEEALSHLACANPDVVEELEKGLLPKFPDEVRAAAARSLGRIGPAAAHSLTPLMQLLKEADPRMKEAGLLGLAGLGPASAPSLESLIPLLADPAPRMREITAFALGSIGTFAKKALPALERACRDENASVQAAAKRAIHQIGPAEPLPAP